jgi:hypothetical protein
MASAAWVAAAESYRMIAGDAGLIRMRVIGWFGTVASGRSRPIIDSPSRFHRYFRTGSSLPANAGHAPVGYEYVDPNAWTTGLKVERVGLA